MSDLDLVAWRANAEVWTRAVRERWIPSRAEATNAAVLQTVLELQPTYFVDAGCGEGWLVRAARASGLSGAGCDGVEALIDEARADDPRGEYHRAAHTELGRLRVQLPAPVDLVVFNFSIFDADDLCASDGVRALLSAGGHLVIQTLPGPASGRKRGRESFATLPGQWSPIEYELLSQDQWSRTLDDAGFELRRCARVGTPQQPRSWVLTARAR